MATSLPFAFFLSHHFTDLANLCFCSNNTAITVRAAVRMAVGMNVHPTAIPVTCRQSVDNVISCMAGHFVGEGDGGCGDVSVELAFSSGK